ncbi:MAG: DUF2849 domain-containing protein [Janthinobacterium lividum]
MIKLLTGNELLTGDVVWWTGSGWSLHLRDAVAAGEAALAETAAAERVNDAALIDAEETPDGPRPRTMRERIRGAGPSVRPDLNRVLA